VVPAVRNVSFTVSHGETVGLVGESGSGKTVTALSILRLLPPSASIASGEVTFGGEDLVRAKRRRLNQVRGGEIGMIFQDPTATLNPVLTVGHQLTETLRVHRSLSRRAAAKEAVDLLTMVEIPDARRRVGEYPHQFSGGMRQRATIAMALSCRPKLLIADEPTTALDVTVQAQILELLQRLKKELGMAMLLITHDFGVVAGVADHINVMYAGAIVESGPVETVFESPRHPYTEGLLKSIPKIGIQKTVKLDAIAGHPPEHGAITKGCSFQPRCRYAIERCLQEEPALLPVGAAQSSACWVDIRSARQ
jgi:oligopeptide/dipeptide ABC transporter ATP-binding protein